MTPIHSPFATPALAALHRVMAPLVGRAFVATLAAWVFAGLSAAPTAHAADKLSFNRDIRPILSDACFQCHGPDEKQRKAGLRLDQRASAVAAAESGAKAIVPGDASTSELIARITSTDDSIAMPPAASGKKLTAAQIELLKRWVREGAEYQGHWAFIPVERPGAPAVTASTWPRNSIDRFVLSRLEREGLAPSPEASKPTLIRRVSFDLTGLPPTPKEVDEFVKDASPQAYERMVDRLLASPRYGERMAVQWLDFARYADSNGFQVDSSRQQWPWRDWVINAFNENMPFDQFTIEQLAGDMLPDAKPSQIVATGFNRNHKLNGEGGIIAEEWRVETVIDRVETTGLTWLGLTLNCCRCHDHKYDPISQREFYQFFALFNNVPESGTLQGESRNTDPTMPVVTAAHEAESAKRAAAIAEAERQSAEAAKQLPQLVAAWLPEFRKQVQSQTAAWTTLAPTEVKSLGGAKLTRQDDGSYLASGPNPDHDTYEITAPIDAGPFSGLLLECFVDPSLPQQSLGRFNNGNFVLSRVEAEIRAPGLAEPLKATFNKAAADYSQNGWPIGAVVDSKAGNGWAVDGPTKKENRRAMFVAAAPLTAPAGATLVVRLRHEAITGHNIGRFRLSRTGLPSDAVTLQGAQFPDSLRQALSAPDAERSAAQQTELEKYFRANVDSPLRRADEAVATAKKKLEELKSQLPTVMVMREGVPRRTHLLIRGQYDRPGDEVQPGLPSALPRLAASTSTSTVNAVEPAKDKASERLDRLKLARWIVQPDNPLTARVWVNRAWERFFGAGLVKTTENLGSQSEFPSHPELLDWLSAEFMQPTESPAVGGVAARPWDMKAFQKLIVMSATYRQSSRVTPQLAERDPENRLLARGPRFRLGGEMLRDQALWASGLLVDKLGGPSVRPYMPDGVWDETSRYGDLRNYKHDQGEGLYRRTLYTVWKRTAAPPTMLLFDAPNREICTVKRSRTNTPLQALSLLNEITFVEAARKLGERMMKEGGETLESRVAYGFRLVTARAPTNDELKILSDGLAADLGRAKAQPAEAAKLLAQGEAKPDADLPATELAAYTLTANVLLNLDEVVTRE